MRFIVRALFGLLLMGFVVQLLVAKIGPQPYPGLFQPGFAKANLRGGATTETRVTIAATYANGGTKSFTEQQVMAEAAHSQRVFQSAFGSGGPRRSDPENVGWLKQRLSDLGGGRPPVQAVLSWQHVVYNWDGVGPPRTTITTTDRTVISFGGERD